uniref:SFRICE_032736 n=1 Tax=Spodoptera frugiperda TaxID=7108 RepID=A0A2H1VRT2_SPOFR
MTANNCDDGKLLALDKNENFRATNVTTFDLSSSKINHTEKHEKKVLFGKLFQALPTAPELKQYISVFLCGNLLVVNATTEHVTCKSIKSLAVQQLKFDAIMRNYPLTLPALGEILSSISDFASQKDFET